MAILISLTSDKGETVYVSVRKIRYLEITKQDYTKIHCYAFDSKTVTTPMPIKQVAHIINSTTRLYRVVPYVDQSGKQAYMNIDYISTVEADKQGNAKIECRHHGVGRDIFTTQTTIADFISVVNAIDE